jgi:PAS domain S-box-containing protein
MHQRQDDEGGKRWRLERVTRPAARIALAYALIAGTWIIFSDRLLSQIFRPDTIQKLTWLQHLKGVFFVVVTALLLYWLITRSLAAILDVRARLDESQQRYRRLVQHAEEGIITLDEQDRITFANPKFAEMVRQPLEKIVGRRMHELVAPEQHDELAELLASRRRGLTDHHDMQLITADGRDLWVLVVGTPMLHDNGTYAGTLKMLTDITARRAAEQQVRELNEQLERRVQHRTAELHEANEQLEAFTYSISHDFQGSLNSIASVARALLEDPAAAPAVADGARRIIAMSRRIDDMAQELLQYSHVKRDAMDLRRVNIELLVTQILGQLQPAIERAQAHVQVQPPLHAVRAHRPALSVALTNLISNAITFASQGARPVVQISAQCSDGWVRIVVDDNGIGVSETDRERIFHPFQRLAPQFPGTGLGLTIVRRAIHRMGGRVGVESKPERGSRFWIELPGDSDD